MGFHKLVNTAQFSITGKDFWKNGKNYTKAPRGSRDYFEFWEREEERCLYGYQCGDLWIPGRMYFWLNFFPIMKVPDELINRTRVLKSNDPNYTVKIAEKTTEFAKFWEVHYEWWNLKHIAWYSGDFLGIQSDGGKHIGCVKTRGAGFSYLEACDAVYNYTFIEGSKSYFFAGLEAYLNSDGIMNKVQDGLDWINDHCPYWKKNRKVKYSVLHQRASYYDVEGVERGDGAEIIGQVVDRPSKTRGKRGRKATFEEAGSFPSLEPALEVCMGSMRANGVYVGQISVFGTGGEAGPGIQGLENVFNNPAAWDMLEFKNIWEEGYENTTCGYFVPCYRVNEWHADEHGNIDIKAAVIEDEIERKKKKKSNDPKALDRRMAEYPRNPREALSRLTGNGFNGAEVSAQIARIKSDSAYGAMVRHGDLIYENSTRSYNGVSFEFKPKHIAHPIETYPHSQDGYLTGCVSILEMPYLDIRGQVPKGAYLLTFDSYYKEESDDLTSLWCCQVWKMDNQYSQSFLNVPVAWYSGRPGRYENNHEIMFKMAQMYNAKIQGEIAGGGQSVVTYARTHKKLHFLCNELELGHNKNASTKAMQTSYLMDMGTDRKRTGILYLEDWHIKPKGLNEFGTPILTISNIFDLAWLEEMKKFDPVKGNFDRISCALPAMYMIKEHFVQYKKERRKQENRDSFYNRKLFGGEKEAYTEGATIDRF